MSTHLLLQADFTLVREFNEQESINNLKHLKEQMHHFANLNPNYIAWWVLLCHNFCLHVYNSSKK